jgi:hypothetical protein
MSRCKTGWRIVCPPWKPWLWYAVNERIKTTQVFKSWPAAFFFVYEHTAVEYGSESRREATVAV